MRVAMVVVLMQAIVHVTVAEYFMFIGSQYQLTRVADALLAVATDWCQFGGADTPIKPCMRGSIE